MLLFTLSFLPHSSQPLCFPDDALLFPIALVLSALKLSTSLLPLDLSYHFLKEDFPDPLECQIPLSHYLIAL